MSKPANLSEYGKLKPHFTDIKKDPLNDFKIRNDNQLSSMINQTAGTRKPLNMITHVKPKSRFIDLIFRERFIKIRENKICVTLCQTG